MHHWAQVSFVSLSIIDNPTRFGHYPWPGRWTDYTIRRINCRNTHSAFLGHVFPLTHLHPHILGCTISQERQVKVPFSSNKLNRELFLNYKPYRLYLMPQRTPPIQGPSKCFRRPHSILCGILVYTFHCSSLLVQIRTSRSSLVLGVVHLVHLLIKFYYNSLIVLHNFMPPCLHLISYCIHFITDPYSN